MPNLWAILYRDARSIILWALRESHFLNSLDDANYYLLLLVLGPFIFSVRTGWKGQIYVTWFRRYDIFNKNLTFNVIRYLMMSL